MQRVFSILVATVWGLWLGGLVTLVLSVISLAHSFHGDDYVFGKGAAAVFNTFERYQLGLATAALLLTLIWRVLGGAARLKTTLFVLFALASLLAVAETLYVSPWIESMMRQGLARTPEFQRAHGIAGYLYSGILLLLLASGGLLPFIIRPIEPKSL